MLIAVNQQILSSFNLFYLPILSLSLSRVHFRFHVLREDWIGEHVTKN
jgi:hypothetical protein